MISSIALTLTACASLNSDFECKMQPGVTCKSLDEINTMVDKGQFSANDPLDINKSIASEKVLNMWIAPFEDTDGNYHHPHRISTVVATNDGISQI